MKYGQNANMESNNHKLISVVVPCFNSGKTLERTIESIKNQTWDEKEIILVNDGSSYEKTLEVLKGYKNDSQIKVVDQKNKGLSSARNTGVIHARGNYLFFLDSDDWINSNALEEFFIFLQNNKSSSYVFSDSVRYCFKLFIAVSFIVIIYQSYSFFLSQHLSKYCDLQTLLLDLAQALHLA